MYKSGSISTLASDSKFLVSFLECSLYSKYSTDAVQVCYPSQYSDFRTITKDLSVQYPYKWFYSLDPSRVDMPLIFNIL